MVNILFARTHDISQDRAGSIHARELITRLNEKNNIILLAPSEDHNPSLSNEFYNLNKDFTINESVIGQIVCTILSFFYTIRNIKKIDIVCQRLQPLFLGGIIKLLFNKKFIFKFADSFEKSLGEEHRLPNWFVSMLKPFSRIIEKVSCLSADKIITVTTKLKKKIIKEYGIDEEKIKVISNGANTRLFKPLSKEEMREKLNFSQEKTYICFVGCMRHFQGLKTLVLSATDIVNEFPDSVFLIVGSGPMKNELVNIVNRLSLSQYFRFIGKVPYDQVPLYINASDVCVAPFTKFRSKTGSSALKVYEYASCGKPVVVSTVSGMEFVEKKKIGILTEPENPENLAEGIITLLKKDENDRKKMGERGRKIVKENYSWEANARETERVCQRMLT